MWSSNVSASRAASKESDRKAGDEDFGGRFDLPPLPPDDDESMRVERSYENELAFISSKVCYVENPAQSRPMLPLYCIKAERLSEGTVSECRETEEKGVTVCCDRPPGLPAGTVCLSRAVPVKRSRSPGSRQWKLTLAERPETDSAGMIMMGLMGMASKL